MLFHKFKKNKEVKVANKSEVLINGDEYIKKSCVIEELAQGDISNPFMVVGKDYFVKTVTEYYTGELLWVGEHEIVINNVAWIADTGRFNEFLIGKTVNEVEPYPKNEPVIIGRGAIVSMVRRKCGLLLEVK